MKVTGKQFRDLLVLALGIIFLTAGIRVISQYIQLSSGSGEQRIYVQAAPLIGQLTADSALVKYESILRRCRVEFVLVQSPATLSMDLVENLGAPEFMEQYSGRLDTLANLWGSLQEGFSFTHIPYAGWRLRMKRARDRFFLDMAENPERKVQVDSYRAYHAQTIAAAGEVGGHGSVFQMNQDAFDEINKQDYQYFTDTIGPLLDSETGYEPVNTAYYQWIDATLRAHPNTPILIVYDATQVWWLVEQLSKRENLRIIRPKPKLGFSLFGRWKVLLGR
jgi:hypothetical protein